MKTNCIRIRLSNSYLEKFFLVSAFTAYGLNQLRTKMFPMIICNGGPYSRYSFSDSDSRLDLSDASKTTFNLVFSAPFLKTGLCYFLASGVIGALSAILSVI